MLTPVVKAFSLCVISQDIYSGEVFDERFPPVTAQARDRCDKRLGMWLFFNAYLPLLDGWRHKVLDEHFGGNFGLGRP